MESIRRNLAAQKLSLDESQAKRIPVTGRNGRSTLFEDLGSTNFITETKDTRTDRKGKAAGNSKAGRSGSRAQLDSSSSSEGDDELNIHAGSSLPGSPAVTVSSSTKILGVAFEDRFRERKFPNFKKKKDTTKPENDENSPVIEIPSDSPKKATRSRRGNASPARSKPPAPGPSKSRTSRRNAEPSEGTSSSRESRASSLSLLETATTNSIASGSGSKDIDPIGSLQKQKDAEVASEEKNDSKALRNSRRTAKRSSSDTNSSPKDSKVPVKSSCPIDDLQKEETSPPATKKKRKTKPSVPESDDEDDEEQEGRRKTRAKGKGKASGVASVPEARSYEPAPFPMQHSPGHKEQKSTSSSTDEPVSKPSELAPFPLQRSSRDENPSNSSSSPFLTLVGVSNSGQGQGSVPESSKSIRKLAAFPLDGVSLPPSSQLSAKRSSDEDDLDSSPVKRMRSDGLDPFEDYSIADDFSFTQDVKGLWRIRSDTN
ncbi:hypothetical protein SCHPADRAFT_142105 [Schizopora paradoxa]|uniref:Uncharacterized protein n=1 Tax=Schizopora paradoxa TaxID=27342 RepID=A0A0H2S0Y4_9AGAM|nr:hypothetical protein SCHPADRAFT_142105 [Schizopora paradoxa]